MNDSENKRILWDLTKHMYKAWMPRERVIQTFEDTIREVDASSAPLLDKNKAFLQVYLERVAALQPETAQEREHMFEDRQKNHELNVIHVPTPPKKVAFEGTHKKVTDGVLEELADLKKTTAAMMVELVDVRKMVHILLDRTQSRL